MTRDERQDLVIEKWKAAGCRSTVVANTGFGKTRTALKAMQRVLNKAPSAIIVVIVPTKILKDQWIKQLKEWDIPATVMVINTAAKRPFHCNFLVLDEAHKYNSVYFSKVFENCSPKLILGLTATYERLDSREKEIMDKFCPVCDTITLDESVENGWTAPYTLYKVILNVDTSAYVQANTAFMNHFAFFNFEWDLAMGCVCSLEKRLKLAKQMNCSVQEVTAHAFGWNRAMQFRKGFIANHPKKIEVAKHILANRKDVKAITFNTSIKQCEAYGFGHVVHSQKKDKENKIILDDFAKAGPGEVLHNSKVAKEGYDCPGLGLMVVTGFHSDKISLVQTIGRVIRFEPGKHSEIFILTLQGCQDNKWFQKASEGMEYVEIDEQELETVLQRNPLNKKPKVSSKFRGIRY
jgi:superfamily II DNA or RNA helicase